MSKRIVRFKEGEKIPDNAVFIEKVFEQGRKIGESVVGHGGFFPFDYTTYKNVFEEIPVYIYEISDGL